ncbi:hypothetical protein N7530_012738 [Penicillium desertorum]|uniref:Uncharacterized protein n=1 Tax=Penicillium desertorum TaxID=1303715 RepID=A0A9W9WDY2_9EURO|nr:hypothetical protein N7530_012738 [Penicillium desertorum]
MDQPSRNGYHSDLDTEAAFTGLREVLAPPPFLATGNEGLCLSYQSLFPMPTGGRMGRHSSIECYFYPSYDSACAQEWKGPDLLSLSTCTEDVFIYLSTFHLLEKLDCAEIRLWILSNEGDGMLEVYPFFLARGDSMLGSLPQFRKLVQDVIATQDMEKSHFRLSIRPRNQGTPGSLNAKRTPNIWPMVHVPASPLDPYLFVENIVGGYRRY